MVMKKEKINNDSFLYIGLILWFTKFTYLWKPETRKDIFVVEFELFVGEFRWIANSAVPFIVGMQIHQY